VNTFQADSRSYIEGMNQTTSIPTIIALSKFAKQAGISSTTAWRWRCQGILPTINVNGRVFVTSQAAEEFIAKATAGAFEKRKPVPPPPRAATAED
jgi:hypothetical protein